MLTELMNDVNPEGVVLELKELGWVETFSAKEDVKVLQYYENGVYVQTVIPLSKEYSDYIEKLSNAINIIAERKNEPKENVIIKNLSKEVLLKYLRNLYEEAVKNYLLPEELALMIYETCLILSLRNNDQWIQEFGVKIVKQTANILLETLED